MAKERQIVVRLEAELAGRLDAYVARVRDETGIEITQSQAVRRLLTLGLDATDTAKPKRKG